MTDADCVALLQWALPRMGMRWPGFRKVRRQVCKRIARRIADLGLPDLAAYRAHLEARALAASRTGCGRARGGDAPRVERRLRFG
jgi:hypothetical protein